MEKVTLTEKEIIARYPGVDETDLRCFLAIRKTKKATNTIRAWEMLEREFSKAGLTIQDGVRYCLERDWKGFKADWHKDGTAQQQSKYHGFSRRDYKAGLTAVQGGEYDGEFRL